MNRFLRNFCFTAALLSAGAVFAQTKIVLGGAMPVQGPDSRAFTAFAQRVEQQSKGQIKFDLSYDGQVVNFRSSLGASRTASSTPSSSTPPST